MRRSRHSRVNARFINRQDRYSIARSLIGVLAITLLWLLSHQRSGSHFLKETLCLQEENLENFAGRHLALPEVFTEGSAAKYPAFKDWCFEPFHDERLRENPLKWGDPQGLADAVSLFMDMIHEKAGGRIVLADIKLNQLYIGEGWFHQTTAPPRMFYGLADKSKLIFLRRRNLVRALVSGLLATKTGVWHTKHEDTDTSDPVKITIDIDNFMSQLTHLDRGLAEADCWLNAYPDTVHRVFYEDLFDANTLACNAATFDAIATFAGIGKAIEWRPSQKKIGMNRLEDIIENFDELQIKLLPTKYSSML